MAVLKANIISVRGFTPKIPENVYVANNATIIGDVTIGQGSSIWFNTVLRGDVFAITIGEYSNLQDGTIVHGTYQKCGTAIGDRVTIGHGVILHGCQIDDLCLIGMGALIMDNAHIEKRSIVGAGSLVTEGMVIPEGMLAVGRPAKVVRHLNEKELAFLEQSAKNYVEYSSWYASETKGI